MYALEYSMSNYSVNWLTISFPKSVDEMMLRSEMVVPDCLFTDET